MSEIDELRQLVAQQTRDMQTQNAQSQKMVADLIAELARARALAEDDGAAAVAAAATARATAVAVRAEKINKMSLALHKSQKVREFKEVNDISIKEWLTRFDQKLLL